MSQTELHRLVNQVYSGSTISAGTGTSTVYVVDNFASVSYIVDLTAVGGSPSTTSLAVKIQYSPDVSGSRWYDLPNTTLTLTGVSTANIVNAPLLTARRVRLSYTLGFTGGTSPTVTFSADLSVGNTSPSGNVTSTGEAVSISDGANVVEGTTTDAAITTNTTGSISGKLRGLVAIFADVWDSTNHRLLAHVGGTVASGATDSGNPVKTGGKYNATLPTLTDGQRGDTQLDANGLTRTTNGSLNWGEDPTAQTQGVTQKPVVSATYSWTPGNAVYNDVDVAVKASPGQLRQVRVNNKNAAERYLWIINKTTAPSGDTTFMHVFPLALSTPNLITFDFGESGLYCSTGISIGVSTSATTFTAATTTDHSTSWLYA